MENKSQEALSPLLFFSIIFGAPVDRTAAVELKWGLMLSVHMHMNIHNDRSGFHAVCSSANGLCHAMKLADIWCFSRLVCAFLYSKQQLQAVPFHQQKKTEDNLAI